jgi:hypothetical protein
VNWCQLRIDEPTGVGEMREIPGIGDYGDAFDQISKAANVDVAIQAFKEVYNVSLIPYHLAQTIAEEVDAPFVRTTYPDAWVSRYLRRRKSVECHGDTPVETASRTSGGTN